MAIAANCPLAKIVYYNDKSIKPLHLVSGLYCNCLKVNPFRDGFLLVIPWKRTTKFSKM